jgi:4-alpha-glucanotransferase
VSTDDLAGMVERPNHPGTSNDEQPNWCRRLPCSVEALVHQEPGRTLIATVRAPRPS